MTHRTQLPQKEAKALKLEHCKKRLCGRGSLREKVLKFIRRNRVFRAGDLVLVFDMKISYAKWLIWDLKKRGVITLRGNAKRFEDRYFFYRGDGDEKS